MPQPWGLLVLFAASLAILCVWGGVMTGLQALRPQRKALAWALATGRAKDPADLDLKFDEIECSSGQRHPCPAWRIAGRAADPLAPILLMVHGWGRSRWDSLARVGPFLGACSELVLLDLPAHGEHRAALSSVGAHEPACVLHALQEISRQSPGRPLILAGHSMGAGIALRVALLAEPLGLPIAGVIAFSPYRTLRSPIPGRLALKELPQQPFSEIAILTLRLLGRMDRPLEIDAARLKAPLLVLAGDGDPISPADDARRIAQASPRGTLSILRYQRHDDLRQGDPEKFDRALGDFLNAITAPSAEAAGRA
ncbi:MAG: alpha/beta fold hydrolase [Planctomycetes bacterium]|nr:alpha/beta fold hydrolase [Planctomycetota bacterium]